MQVAKLLIVLRTRLCLGLRAAGLLRVGANTALLALLGDEVADFLALLGDELAPFGGFEIFRAQFVALLGLQVADLIARLIARSSAGFGACCGVTVCCCGAGAVFGADGVVRLAAAPSAARRWRRRRGRRGFRDLRRRRDFGAGVAARGGGGAT